MNRRLLVAALLVLSAACLNLPDVHTGRRFLCHSTTDCNDGFACIGGYCSQALHHGDAAPALSSDAMVFADAEVAGPPDEGVAAPDDAMLQVSDAMAMPDSGVVQSDSGHPNEDSGASTPDSGAQLTNCEREAECCPTITDSTIQPICNSDVNRGSESGCAGRLCNIASESSVCMAEACAIGCRISGCTFDAGQPATADSGAADSTGTPDAGHAADATAIDASTATDASPDASPDSGPADSGPNLDAAPADSGPLTNCQEEAACCPNITNFSVRQVCMNDVANGSQSGCAVRLCNLAQSCPACMHQACAVGCALPGC